jgi:hypothetical protein
LTTLVRQSVSVTVATLTVAKYPRMKVKIAHSLRNAVTVVPRAYFHGCIERILRHNNETYKMGAGTLALKFQYSAFSSGVMA